jgi:glycosyltransferase involved in cell wall biosynthesis
VTIGLPVWNAEPHLEAALRSIFAQTVPEWELLIMDDGSLDRSLEIAQSLRDARVRVISDGKHLGLGARLNQIAQHAEGEYLARMDADDMMHPRRLEKQLAQLRADSTSDVVGCGMVILNKTGQPVGARRLPLAHEAITADRIRQMRLAHATAMAKTEWWRRQKYDEAAPLGVEDWRFWIEAALSTRYGNVAELLYYYREFDSFRLSNYLKNKRGLISRLWSLPQVPVTRAVADSLRHVASAAVFSVAALAGVESTLISRRNEPLKSEEFDECSRTIDQLSRVTLPIR